MNLEDLLQQMGGGGAVNQLSRQFGLDQNQTTSALGALLPTIAGAMQRNASGGGLEGLLGMLSGGQHAQVLDDPSLLASPDTVAGGNDLLGQLFGHKDVSRELANRASAQSGVGADILKQMLPLVATMVMGGLSRQSSGNVSGNMGMAANASGGGGLGDMLGGMLGGGGAQQAAGSGGGGIFDMLAPMIDKDRDGSMVDDILGMAAKYMTNR